MRDRPTLKGSGNILVILSISLVLLGLLSLGYGNRLPPLQKSEPLTKTQTTCIAETEVARSTTTLLTTTGKTIRVLTYTTTRASVSSAGPSCPYGGTYYAAKYTRLCGWQYDVCITFDYNCANDYHAAYLTHTIVQTLRLTTTSTQNLVQTTTDTLESTVTSTFCSEFSAVDTTVHEAPNPKKSYFGTLGTVLIVVGIIGLSGMAWNMLVRSDGFKRGISRLTKLRAKGYRQMDQDAHTAEVVHVRWESRPTGWLRKGRMITVRYPARCAKIINPGEKARWKKGIGIWHDQCY